MSESIEAADKLYRKREAELADGDHYKAGQTWAEFQKVVCSNWPLIATLSRPAGDEGVRGAQEETIRLVASAIAGGLGYVPLEEMLPDSRERFLATAKAAIHRARAGAERKP